MEDGSVRLAGSGGASKSLPFLFDTSAMPSRAAACDHCKQGTHAVYCCGVCTFGDERCEQQYPGQNKSAIIAAFLQKTFPLQDFTPCELFQRIRGRTLWFMGDSQTWSFYYAAECFLREFAPSLVRKPAVAVQENNQMRLVQYISAPLCLELVHGTRVCAVRVDNAADMKHKVLARLARLVPRFPNDIMILNTGLHYTDYSRPWNFPASTYIKDLTALATWRQQYKDKLPSMIWADTGPQHFNTRDGTYPGNGERPFKCRPLTAWSDGNPVVAAGTWRNKAVAPLLPRLADAHLRLFNASVPLWNSHIPGECSHWCHPSAYQLWLFLLNGVLRDSGLGNAVPVAGASGGATAASATAAAPSAAGGSSSDSSLHGSGLADDTGSDAVLSGGATADAKGGAAAGAAAVAAATAAADGGGGGGSAETQAGAGADRDADAELADAAAESDDDVPAGGDGGAGAGAGGDEGGAATEAAAAGDAAGGEAHDAAGDDAAPTDAAGNSDGDGDGGAAAGGTDEAADAAGDGRPATLPASMARRFCGRRDRGGGGAPLTWQEVDKLISQPAGLHGRLQKAGPPAGFAGAMQHMVNMNAGMPAGLPSAITPEISAWLVATRKWNGLRRFEQVAARRTRTPPRPPPPAVRSPISSCHYLVDHKHRLIFIRSTKIGGTSISDQLGIANHPVMCKWQPQYCEAGCEGRPFCLRYMTTPQAVPAVWMNYTVFAFTRNPWTRAISSHHFNHRRAIKPECREKFSDFAANPSLVGQLCYDRFSCCQERFGFVLEHVEPQSPSCLFTSEGQPAVDFLGRAEHLEEDFQSLLVLLNSRRQAGEPPLNISDMPNLNTADGSGDKKRRYYAEHYVNNTASLCDVRNYYDEDFGTLRFPAWKATRPSLKPVPTKGLAAVKPDSGCGELAAAAAAAEAAEAAEPAGPPPPPPPVVCTRAGAAAALHEGEWQELKENKCDPKAPLMASCTAPLGHQWVWRRKVCTARHYTETQLRARLKGRSVTVLGDSHGRILFTWLHRKLNGSFTSNFETFPKFYHNASWHGVAATAATAASPKSADLHLTFRWHRTLPPVVQDVWDMKSSGQFPDVVVLSAASWYYVEGLPLKVLEEHLQQLAGAVEAADAAASKAGKRVLWLLMTVPDRVRGRSWSATWHAPLGVVPQYNRVLRGAAVLHPQGPALLLDVQALSQSCLAWCSADGTHANAAVNALGIQLMANLLDLPPAAGAEQ
ncbi:hypothetical protein C2E20_1285 [Micractinium conductrix]|uniref:Uncharacterized protein n=1 Tax=Micractinium conductrix TaxID=554055 RepID=A0A2P6VMV0_9CHLO|nr:hypothetical protein C2E20_1285 [Micractinium conductrix]|eukprot:PSC75375.1 hypothetical protein C2E20_1285 [Micractinium conductrix]